VVSPARCQSCQRWLQTGPAGYLCGKGSRPVWVIRDCADYRREPGSDDDYVAPDYVDPEQGDG
jgi:hypothetical protein